jgi:hypothetical protein
MYAVFVTVKLAIVRTTGYGRDVFILKKDLHVWNT